MFRAIRIGHEARNDEPQLYDQTGSAVAGDLMLKCLEFLYRAEAALRARLTCTESRVTPSYCHATCID